MLPQPLETRQRRPPQLLTGIAVALLAVVAFVVGRNSAPDRDVLTMARNASVPAARAIAPPTDLRYDEAFPSRAFPPTPVPGAPSEATATDQLPEAFARQLRQPPSIAPSPGSPPAAATPSAAKPFGLED